MTILGGSVGKSVHARLLATLLISAGLLTVTQVKVSPPLVAHAAGPPPGTIDTVAGGGLGEGIATQISQHPSGLALQGTHLYVADDQANAVRMLDLQTGIEAIVAGTGVAGSAGDGGLATGAEVASPEGLALDASGNLYITTVSYGVPADNRVRKVTPAGVISTVAGGGASTAEDVDATTAVLSGPQGVAVNSSGDLFFADTGHNEIRMVNHSTGHIATVAGNGTIGFSGDGGAATSAQLHYPADVWVSGSTVLVADTYNFVVRSFAVGGNISTIAGNGNFSGLPPCPSGPALNATLFYIYGVSVDSGGNMFFTVGNCVVKDAGGTISVVAGNGQNAYGTGGPADGSVATSVALASPKRVVTDGAGNVYVSDYYDLKVLRVDATNHLTTVAGNGGVCSYSGDGFQATRAEFCNAGAITVDGAGNLYVADVGGSRDTVREVTTDGVINTIAGNGTRGNDGLDGSTLATAAQLNYPIALAVNASGDLFIADLYGYDVRRVDHLSHHISRYAGNGTNCYDRTGTAPLTTCLAPTGLAFDAAGNLLILDAGIYIRQVSPDGQSITTRMQFPYAAGSDTLGGVDAAGNIYTSGINNGVWKNGTQQLATGRAHGVVVGPQGQIVYGSDDHIYGLDGHGNRALLAGGGASSAEGVPALSTSIPWVGGMAFDSSGNFYVVDFNRQRVRRMTPYLAPDSPTAVQATAAGSTANVSWSAPTNQTGLAIAAYLVATHSAFESVADVVVTGAPPSPAASVPGVRIHRRYFFTVRAWNGWLWSADSAPSPTVTPLIPSGQIMTYAGGASPPEPGQGSGAGGAATSIGQVPFALGNQGPIVYIGDLVNPVVWETFGGAEDIFAGNDAFDFSGDNGYPQSAGLRGAGAVAYCPAGNVTYIADTFNYRIRKVQNSVISTVVGTGVPGYSGDGGPATKAQIGRVFGLACGADGASLLIADSDNGAIRVLDGSGNIEGLWSGFGFPTGIAVVDANTLLVSDTGTNTVWYLVQNLGACVEAGNTFPAAYGCFPAGATSRAALAGPRGIAFDGRSLYIAEESGNRVRLVDDATGSMTSFAGTGTAGFGGDGGPATSAKLNFPTSVVLSNGALFVADFANTRLRQIDLSTHVITTAAGNGTLSYDGDGGDATRKILGNPDAVAVDAAGNEYFVDNYDEMVRKVDLDGQISMLAGNGRAGYSGNGSTATSATLNDPRGVAVDAAGDIFISDSGNNVVRKVDPSHVISTYVSGLNAPRGLAVDASGNLYVADTGHNRVIKVDGSTHAMTVVAGNGTAGYAGDGDPATTARLSGPRGLAVDATGNLFISDTDNNVVREVAGGIITTVVGNGTAGGYGDGGLAINANLDFPFGLAFDSAGNLLIADTGNQRIRRVDAAHHITTVAGHCGAGFAGDGGQAVMAQLNFPIGVAVDGNGTVLIADSANNRIRAMRGYVSLRAIACQSPAVSRTGSLRIDEGAPRSLRPAASAAGPLPALPGHVGTHPSQGAPVASAGGKTVVLGRAGPAHGSLKPATSRPATAAEHLPPKPATRGSMLHESGVATTLATAPASSGGARPWPAIGALLVVAVTFAAAGARFGRRRWRLFRHAGRGEVN